MSGEHGEPYEVCGAMILKTRPHRFVIASCTSVPDAVRIAACLNALDGVSTKDIEAGAVAQAVAALESANKLLTFIQ